MQLDGTIIAPTNAKAWGSGLLQWLEFTKLRGITIRGKGTIDGRGSVWWQDAPLEDPIDDESRLIVPLNNTVQEAPPMPVINQTYSSNLILFHYIVLEKEKKRSFMIFLGLTMLLRHLESCRR